MTALRTDRRNARLAREVLVILPPELTATQRVQLARNFGQELANRYLRGSTPPSTYRAPDPSSDFLHRTSHGKPTKTGEAHTQVALTDGAFDGRARQHVADRQPPKQNMTCPILANRIDGSPA